MLSLGAATRIYLAAGATDLRKGFEGLFGLVRSAMAEDPLSGHVFVFCNGNRNRIKLLYFDGSGLWICAKRLEGGSFKWPALVQGPNTVRLNRAELTMLLEGIELKATQARKWYRREVPGGAKPAVEKSEKSAEVLTTDACQTE